MGKVVRLILAIVMVILAVGVSGMTAGTACACSCAPLTADEVVSKSAAIVVGRAVAEVEKSDGVGYLFEVEDSYKKRVHQRIEITTSPSSASCGVELEIGETRTLALGRGTPVAVDVGASPPGWTATLCTNISDLGVGTMPAAAGPRMEPKAGTDPSADTAAETTNEAPSTSRLWWFVALVMLVGLAVGGAVIRVMRRR